MRVRVRVRVCCIDSGRMPRRFAVCKTMCLFYGEIRSATESERDTKGVPRTIATIARIIYARERVQLLAMVSVIAMALRCVVSPEFARQKVIRIGFGRAQVTAA